MATSADGVKRLVVWQPDTGWIADVGHRGLLGVRSPVVTPEYFGVGEGYDVEIGRDRTYEAFVTDSEAAEQLRRMRLMGCAARLVSLSWNRGVVWYNPTRFSVTPNHAGPKRQVSDVLRFRNNVFHAQISDEQDLLAFAPWFAAQVIEEYVYNENAVAFEATGNYRIVYGDRDAPAVYTVASAEPAFDLSNNLVSSGTATLDFQFPLGGATLRFEAGGSNVTATLQEKNAAGSVLATRNAGQTFTLNDAVYSLSVVLTPSGTMTAEQPRLFLVSPGNPLGNRYA